MLFRVLLLIIIFLSTASAKTSLDENILIGSVRTIVIEMGRTWEMGDEIHQTVETYDPEGHKIESIHSSYKVGGVLNDEKMGSKNTHSYDPTTKTETITTFNSDGFVYGKRLVVYDDRGNIKKIKTYRANGKQRFKRELKYDEHGREIDSKYIKGDGTLLSHMRTNYRINEQGRVTSTAILKEPGLPVDSDHIKYITVFDQQGKEIEMTVYKNGVFKTKIKMNYDKTGTISEDLHYDQEGTLQEKQTYIYEFDPVGNWIKKITTKWSNKDGKLTAEPPEIIKRTITYYESN